MDSETCPRHNAEKVTVIAVEYVYNYCPQCWEEGAWRAAGFRKLDVGGLSFLVPEHLVPEMEAALTLAVEQAQQ